MPQYKPRRPIQKGDRVFDEFVGKEGVVKMLVILDLNDDDAGEKLELVDDHGIEWEADPSVCRHLDEEPREGVYTDRNGFEWLLDGKGAKRRL